MRVCLVYDHVYPQTVGGAERWMRDLALGLAAAGHDVTYLTMRHWPDGDAPVLTGVRVVGLTHPGRVYRESRRAFGPPVRFGFAVARHLARHGREYDVVHTASFPYFPLLAAGALRRRRGYQLVVDWHEVWTRGYWRRYAGRIAGTIGWRVQRACIRVRHTAFCMSRMHSERLVAEGYRGTPVTLRGLYSGPVEPAPVGTVDRGLVVYAGRHVPEKRLAELVRGLAYARAENADLHLDLYGDGPERPRIEDLVRELGLTAVVRVLGRRSEEEVANAMASAACLATASEREGYGLVVVEAAACGTPSVVVAGAENAAVELVHDGVNGAIAPSASPPDISDALLRVIAAGEPLRVSTSAWFAESAPALQLGRSLELVLAEYARSRVG